MNGKCQHWFFSSFFLGGAQEASLFIAKEILCISFSLHQPISGSHCSMGYIFITDIRLIFGFPLSYQWCLSKKAGGYNDTAYEIVQTSKCTAVWWRSSRALNFIRLIAISVQENLIRPLVLPRGDCLYYIRRKHSAFCPDYIILKEIIKMPSIFI